MTPVFRSCAVRTSLALLFSSWALLTAPAAQAAAVRVSVVDANGKPLVDAVALLEPVGTKAPVKPMADTEVSQSKRQFHPRVTVVTVGTKVTFPNFDTVRHHVYSFSPAKTFELKLYAGGPTVPVLFDKPGVAVLGCNIHDNMAAWIVVAETPWTALSGASGEAKIEGAPAGNYKLRVWHPALPLNTEPPAIAVTLGTADVLQNVKLAVVPES